MSNFYRLSTFVILIYLLINPNDGWCVSAGEEKDAAVIPVKTPNNVEIFVEGKRYKSLEEYKKERSIEDSSGGDQGTDAQEGSSSEVQQEPLSQDERESQGEDKEMLKSNIKNEQGDSGEAKDQNSDLAQLQELLKEFEQKHKEADPITIDPTQVKTIIIPSKSKILSQENSNPSNNAPMK